MSTRTRIVLLLAREWELFIRFGRTVVCARLRYARKHPHHVVIGALVIGVLIAIRKYDTAAGVEVITTSIAYQLFDGGAA